MSTIKEALYSTIDQLSEDETRQVLAFAKHLKHMQESKELPKQLTTDPAIKIPSKQGSSFQRVEPVHGHGKPASQQLLEDRR